MVFKLTIKLDDKYRKYVELLRKRNNYKNNILLFEDIINEKVNQLYN